MKSQSKYKYLEADKYFVLNDRDTYLVPIYISLPKPPPLEMIAGYGLAPEDQVFKRMVVPKKLQSLEKQVIAELSQKSDEISSYSVSGYKIIKEFWVRFNKNSSLLKEEAEFIKHFWWHRIHGYWFFNNGKPTYITGRYFEYLNTWYMPDVKNGYPEYRDRDRRWFLADKYFFETEETFAELDANNKAMKDNSGKYKMTYTGRKLYLGIENTKGRRMGDTNKSLCCSHSMLTTGLSRYASITSYTSDHAEGSFTKMLVPAWQNMYLWLKPIFSNTNTPSTLEYSSPGNVFNEQALGATFDYARTAQGSYYDGKKINAAIVCDEEGKSKEFDVAKRWDQIAECLVQGVNRVGFSYHPTTVEDMDEGGGSNFEKMMEQGDFYVRKQSGETLNRLARIYFRASDGLEGFIDKYGNSVEFDLTDSQRKEGFKNGAYNYLVSQRDVFEKQGTPEAIERLRALKRKFPIEYLDSFIGESGALGWDIKKIDAAIKRIKATHKPKRYRLFRDVLHDTVRAAEDNENGRFVLDYILPDNMAGKKILDSVYDEIKNETVDAWTPMYPGKFLLSVDPVGFTNKTQKELDRNQSKYSKGAAEVFWTNDVRHYNEDQEKNKNNFSGITSIAHYLYRPAGMDEFVEDMLMLAEYYGAMICPESNKEVFTKEVFNRGYSGYFYYELDPITKKRKSMPGVYTGSNKKEMIMYVNDYIKHRSEYDCNLEFWLQAKRMKTIEEMTSYDTVAAYAVGLMGLLGMKGGYLDVVNSERTNALNATDFLDELYF